MSDQPKPTEQDNTAFTHDALPEDFELSQPKPTGDAFVPDTDSFVPEADQRELAKPTGDWTVGFVMELLGFNTTDGCIRIADAHNAALDAAINKARAWGYRQGKLTAKVKLAESQQPLVDALEEVRSQITPPNNKIRIIDSALAKVGK